MIQMLKIIITTLLLLLSIKVGVAQQDYSISGKTLTELKAPDRILPLVPISFITQPQMTTSFPLIHFSGFDTSNLLHNYALKTFKGHAPTAFFCKMEYKLQKKVGFPVRLRLGEVGYERKMEGY